MVERAVKASLNGGEVTPELYGRVDLLKYQTGAKLLRNVIPLLAGGAMKSPGTHFVCDAGGAGRRLIRFEVANDDAITILAADEEFTFIRFGAQIKFLAGHTPLSGSQTTGAEGEVVTLTVPYTLGDLPYLKWVQSNDVLFLFHPDHPIYQLQRLGLYDWAINEHVVAPPIDAPENLAATVNEDVTAVIQTDHQYVVAAIDIDGFESFPSDAVTATADLEAGRGNYVDLEWDPVSGADRYVIYKGNGLIFGFIGYTEDTVYRDDNFAPNLIDSPLRNEVFFDDTGDYPSCGGFSQQRLFVAATDNSPQGIWISQPALFDNFHRSIPAKDDDGIQFVLASQFRQTINHLVPFGTMIAFTEKAEWLIRTVQDDILTAATIDPVAVSWYGSDPFIPPLPIGERCLFIQPKTNSVLDLEINVNATRMHADDLSILARHFVDDRSVVAWGWEAAPYALVKLVMDDGELAQITYNKEQDVWGWSRRTTQGWFRDIAVIPEIVADVAYYIVERVIDGVHKFFVEWHDLGKWTEVEDAFFVDCGLTYDLPVTITGVAVEEDGTLTVTAPGHGCMAADTVQLSLIEGIVSLLEPDYDVNSVWTVDSVDGDDVVLSHISDVPEDLSDTWTSGTGTLRKRVSTLSGLSHLANTPVMVLADGGVIDDLTVDGSGNLAFSEPVARAHVGLPYTGRIETLALDTPQHTGTARVRNIANVNLKVSRSRGILAGRIDQEELYEIKPRSFEVPYSPNDLLEGTYQVNVEGHWTRDAAVAIEMPYPLPSLVTLITPEIDYGEG